MKPKLGVTMTAVSHSLTLIGNVEFDVNRILALPRWQNCAEQKWIKMYV